MTTQSSMTIIRQKNQNLLQQNEGGFIDKVGSYQFLAEPFHCDFSDHLFLGHLGNHMLNAADYHSNERGFGMHYLNTIHRTWVLSRLVIEMEEIPKAYTNLTIETWVESAMRFFTNRNFKVSDATSGKVFGYGRSVWAMIDTETRQPTDILDIQDGKIKDYIVTDKECPIDKPGRVKMSQEAESVTTIDTFYSDVDINGHINSIKYIEHVLNLWSIDWYRHHHLRRIETAFVAEAHGGDRLTFCREETAPNDFSVRVTRAHDDTEVCRCRLLFSDM